MKWGPICLVLNGFIWKSRDTLRVGFQSGAFPLREPLPNRKPPSFVFCSPPNQGGYCQGDGIVSICIYVLHIYIYTHAHMAYIYIYVYIYMYIYIYMCIYIYIYVFIHIHELFWLINFLHRLFWSGKLTTPQRKNTIQTHASWTNMVHSRLSWDLSGTFLYTHRCGTRTMNQCRSSSWFPCVFSMFLYAHLRVTYKQSHVKRWITLL